MNDLAPIVHQDERVVRGLVGMILVTLAGKREHAPDLRFLAGLGEDFGFVARNRRSRLIHLLRVVHDPVGAVFGEDDEVHPRQADFHALNHLGDIVGIRQNLLFGVETRHLVVHDGYADRVVAARDITV